MLDSLEIRNYRNLKHLTIDKLGQVNLLVGKNNTGKTSVLEAMAIHSTRLDELVTIKSLLQRRGEYYPGRVPRRNDTAQDRVTSASENNLRSVQALFTDYEPIYFSTDLDPAEIYIGPKEESEQYNYEAVRLMLRKAYRLVKEDENGRQLNEYVEAKNEDQVTQNDFRLEFKIARGLTINTHSLNSELLFANFRTRPNASYSWFQFVDSKNQTQQSIDSLYGVIALSEKEDSINEALRIIDPQVDRFVLIESDKPLIRLKNGQRRLLSSMGDGMNRVFAIMLSLVNAENNTLLIDEIENGLHYSIQEKLWESIFFLASKLHIQVFATTHSNDAIKTFGEVLKSNVKYSNAQLIKLRNLDGQIFATQFSGNEIAIANETEYIDLR
jgi:predicted ATP-dependent endonuclease of OLD family